MLILGLGTTAGYLVQLIVQLPAVMRGRFHLRPVWDLHHPAVRTVLRLSIWTFGAVLANQVAFNLILVIAGRKSGDVVVFTTAYQFFQLPYAIFAVSIAVGGDPRPVGSLGQERRGRLPPPDGRRPAPHPRHPGARRRRLRGPVQPVPHRHLPPRLVFERRRPTTSAPWSPSSP